MLLGCIADDFTGATDLANTLTRRGMRAPPTIGMPYDRSAGSTWDIDCQAAKRVEERKKPL